MNQHEITDGDRFPLLNESGRRMLNRLRQHPNAPRFNYHCGEKLTAAGLQSVRDFARKIKQSPSGWCPGNFPDWLGAHVRHCWAEIPYFRDRDVTLRTGPALTSELAHWWQEIPLTHRDDLRRQPWSFVPDSAELEDVIVYSTSGTTGNLLSIICDPSVPVRYLPLFETALASYGVSIGGGDRVSILHIAAQRSTYTLMSAMSYFDFAGFAKVNLNPDEWYNAGDREAFIDDCNAEIYTGDPFAFMELAKLDLCTKPKAILSSATTLLPAVQSHLQAHFGCPVIDLYSMNETGPIAYGWRDPWRIFPHQIFVEIVDEQGKVVADGARGEIVVSGGVNPWMPLLRYRTGDRAAMDQVDGHPTLVDFSGRTPVHYYCDDGTIVRSIDVVVALYHLPLPVFRLHQHANGSLSFQTRCDANVEHSVRARLQPLFGSTSLKVERLPNEVAWQGKAIQFTSDFEPT